MIPGIYAATLIPLRFNYECDIENLLIHCQELLKKGCQGIVLFGTTGEGPSFSLEARQKIIEALIAKGMNPHQIIVGICSSSLMDAVALAQTACHFGCAGTLILPPFYYKNVEEKGIIEFYRELIKKVNRPNLKIILYHIPRYSGISITPAIIRELLHEFSSTIVGIKDSEGDLQYAKKIMTEFPQLNYWIGHEIHLEELVREGAAGAISGLANLCPELICALYAHCLDARKPNPVKKLRELTLAIKDYSFVSALKGILKKTQGNHWHQLFPPLIPLDEKQIENLIEKISVLHLN